MSGPLLQDREWIAHSFFLTKFNDANSIDKQRRYFTTASLKFTDTTLGGNLVINPPPQFTRNADIQVEGLYSASKGMGRYYSEAIDDNSQIVNIRFGVAQYNSLTTFFTGFYSSKAGMLARTGRGSAAYDIGRAAGFVVSLAVWPIMVFSWAVQATRFLIGKPTSKYYYLKPAMPLYWNAVTTIINTLAINRGILPRVLGADSDQDALFGTNLNPTAADLQTYSNLLPDIFSPDGGIDVYAVANRAQRLQRKQHLAMQQAADADGATLDTVLNSAYSASLTNVPKHKTIKDYLASWWGGVLGRDEKETVNIDGTVNSGSGAITDEKMLDKTKDQGAWQRLVDFYTAELDDGSAFASFRVDATGPISESFSNTTMQSEIQGKINGISASSRSTNFSLENGNITELLTPIMDSVEKVVAGASESVGLSGLISLSGGAFVDIPNHWDQSTASLPHASYTMKLISPYGNPISQLMNIDFPLAMILAGALPLATGPQSYTSPFLCEFYDRGHCQTRLGIIDSLSITRGTSNLGFNDDRHAMAVDVTFSIADLSSVMTMPIAEGISLDLQKNLFSDDTVFTDYLNVLAAMGMADQIYTTRKLKLNMTRALQNWNTFFSISHFASWMGGNSYLPPSKLMSAFYKGANR